MGAEDGEWIRVRQVELLDQRMTGEVCVSKSHGKGWCG